MFAGYGERYDDYYKMLQPCYLFKCAEYYWMLKSDEVVDLVLQWWSSFYLFVFNDRRHM